MVEREARPEITFWGMADVLAWEFPECFEDILGIADSLAEVGGPRLRVYPHDLLEGFVLLPLQVEGHDPRAERASRLLDELLVHPDEDVQSAAFLVVVKALAENPAWDRIAPRLGPLALEAAASIRRN